jgi:hypothetical protein
MDVFAVGVLIFLLLCIIVLIISIVLFPNNPASTTVTTVTNVPDATPGNKVVGADVDHPLVSSGHYWHHYNHLQGYDSNIDASTNLSFLNELYEQLAHSQGGITTVGGSHSNIYVNNLLSGASGASTSNATFTDYSGQNVNSFSDYDLAAYSPY